MPETLRIETRQSAAWIWLARPELHNAFDDRLIAELQAALEAVEADPAVRVVVLASEGPSFSAGADLGWMRAMARASERENLEDARRLARMMRKLDTLTKPTVARVQGPAYGGGVGLVTCCDIAVASEAARFCLSEVKLGLVPAVISPYVVAAVGPRQARRLFLTAEVIDARHAETLGLIHECCAADALDARVEALVNQMLRAGPRALDHAKALVRSVQFTCVQDHQRIDEDNAALIARLRVSPEGQEGLGAFLDKRRPNWLAD